MNNAKCFVWAVLFCCVQTVQAQQTVPDFSLRDLHHQEVSYSEIKGEKLTIIDFWATWCGPCIKAIPKLVALSEKYKGDGVRFVGINVDGPRSLSTVRPVAHALSINYPVLMDDNSEVMGLLSVDKMPTLLIVDANDRVLAFYEGYTPGDADKLVDKIETLLKDE